MTTAKPIFFGAFLIVARTLCAQFTPALLQNNSYWGDGKAEFNIYGAEIVRNGIPRQCEVLHIYARDQVDSVPVLRLNQILNIPTGLTMQQQMHSNYWRVDNGQLMKFCLTSSDGVTNTYKDMQAGVYVWIGASGNTEHIETPLNGYFYDELPWLVRTIDFSKPSMSFEIKLAPSIIKSQEDNFEFKPAKISFKTTERTIDVSVTHAQGEDHFTLDRNFPYLLREWKAADGSHLKMKRNLKVDYLKYDKPGDRERALNDPMLRLPD